MCEENNTWELRQQAQEFFVYADLGIVPKRIYYDYNYPEYLKHKEWKYENYCAYMCAKRAYLDFCRTLKYNKDSNKKEDFKEAVYCYLAKNAENSEAFDLIYNVFGIAKKVEYKSVFLEGFKYGQAQKWVNMTRKYLYLLGIITEIDSLHIPIDSYIKEALTICNLDVPKKKWSKWGKLDYKLFKANLPSDKDIIWENEAWIRVSEKRKGLKDNDRGIIVWR